MALVLGDGGYWDKDVRERREGWENKGVLRLKISAPTETQGRELEARIRLGSPIEEIFDGAPRRLLPRSLFLVVTAVA